MSDRLHGQCSYSINAVNNCLPVTLQLSSATAPSKIVWKKNGIDDQTVNASWELFGSAILTMNISAGLFIDEGGNIYISAASAVLKYAPGSTTGTVVAGGNGSGAAANQLGSASGIFVDASGNIYISDESNFRIQKWAPGATTGTTVAGGNGMGAAANQFNQVKNLFVRPNGDIYAVDYNNHRIQKWTPGAVTGITVAGTGAPGTASNQLYSPYDIEVDAAGNLYVIDIYYIKRFAAGSAVSTTLSTPPPGSLLRPCLFMDGNLNLYYSTRSSIERVLSGASDSPAPVAGIGTPGSTAYQLSNVLDFYIDNAGKINALDQQPSYQRLMQFDPAIPLTYAAASAGTYSAAVTNFKGCTGNTNSYLATTSSSPTITVTTPATSICQGMAAVFTAAVSNAGTPLYTWKKNNAVVGNNANIYSDNAISNRDTISCTVTNTNTGCFKSNSVIMEIKPAIEKGIISSNTNCIPATLTMNSSSASRITWRYNNSNLIT
ncbi:MAG: hypothetical protein EOP51_26120, partial [Sphingobacteriales bacterium]